MGPAPIKFPLHPSSQLPKSVWLKLISFMIFSKPDEMLLARGGSCHCFSRCLNIRSPNLENRTLRLSLRLSARDLSKRDEIILENTNPQTEVCRRSKITDYARLRTPPSDSVLSRSTTFYIARRRTTSCN